MYFEYPISYILFLGKPQSSSSSIYISLKRERFELLQTEMQSVRGCQSVAAFRSILSPSLIWPGASEVDGRLFWAVSAKCSTYVWLEVPGPPIAAYAGPLGRRGHGLLACLLGSRGHFRTLGETSSLSWRYDPCTELIGVHCQLLSFAFLSDWSYFGPVRAGTFCSTFFANVSFCHVTLVNREISKSWKLSKICWNLLNKFQSVVSEISYIHS